jgi:hypothetical protein
MVRGKKPRRNSKELNSIIFLNSAKNNQGIKRKHLSKPSAKEGK